MKKNYNVPATEVVTFAGYMLMADPASPAANNPDPNNNVPGGISIP